MHNLCSSLNSHTINYVYFVFNPDNPTEFEIYNYVGCMTTHTNPYGTVTTWVVSANK